MTAVCNADEKRGLLMKEVSIIFKIFQKYVALNILCDILKFKLYLNFNNNNNNY